MVFALLTSEPVEKGRFFGMAKGFVNERLHVIDSTHTLAKVDTIKFGRSKNRDRGKDDDDMKGHPDQDARWGFKKKDKPFFGYKMHAGMDADSLKI